MNAVSKTMSGRRSPKALFRNVAIIAGGVLFLALLLLTNWPWYLSWLIAVNVTTFLLYGYDKFQAPREGTRVPEVVLHGLALAGGFVGGWLGMLLFRHKIRKPVFPIVLAIASILWIVLLYFLRSLRR